MRLCVFGAGAVGGYLAGHLAQGAAAVSVVARGAHLAAIRANGLRVETPSGAITARVTASDDPADLGAQDVVLVTVKAPSLPSVAASIVPLLGPDTVTAFIMNGIPWWYFAAHGGPYEGRPLPTLDPGGALRRAVGLERTIGGVFWPACSVPAPGVVRLLAGAGSGTILGEPDGRLTPRIQALADAFRAANLPVTISADLRSVLWRKLAFNLSAGPMCVLTETAVMQTQTQAALVACSERLLAEAKSVAACMGIVLDIDAASVAASNATLRHRPSILQDLEAGRPMEVEALYGVPLDMARMVGVETPTLDLLAALIRTKARSRGLYQPAD